MPLLVEAGRGGSMTWLEGNYFVLPNAVRRLVPIVGTTAAAVYMCLASRADRDGRCWPSIDTIAQDAGITRRPAQMALAKLVDVGLVEITKGATPKGASKANVYQLLIPRLEGAANSTGAATSADEGARSSAGRVLPEAQGGRCEQHGEGAATSADEGARSSAQTNNSFESPPKEATPKKKGSKPLRVFSEIDRQLAEEFWAHVRTLDAGAPKPTPKDLDQIRLLRERHERSPEDIRRVIVWLSNPACWWRGKVVTFKNFKEKFATLIAQSQESRNGSPRTQRSIAGQQYDRTQMLEGFS